MKEPDMKDFDEAVSISRFGEPENPYADRSLNMVERDIEPVFGSWNLTSRACDNNWPEIIYFIIMFCAVLLAWWYYYGS